MVRFLKMAFETPFAFAHTFNVDGVLAGCLAHLEAIEPIGG